MAIDGTLRSPNCVLYCYCGVVESENSIIDMISKDAIPEAIGVILISGRDKGLEAAEDTVYGCCFHSKGGFTSVLSPLSYFSLSLAPDVWS